MFDVTWECVPHICGHTKLESMMGLHTDESDQELRSVHVVGSVSVFEGWSDIFLIDCIALVSEETIICVLKSTIAEAIGPHCRLKVTPVFVPLAIDLS